MPKRQRNLQPGYAYHVTTRCNNREFKLSRRACREVFLYAIKRALNKFNFRLYALCIMSNHVHYLIEPKQPQDLPKIMHDFGRDPPKSPLKRGTFRIFPPY